jgi:tripartite-type tricarboxylate transporter receptor subunit TctC
VKAIMRWLAILIANWLAVFGLTVAHASTFPERPVRFIVGFAPGGSTDTSARIVARKLSEKWGQPVVVENRAGADSTIAGEVVSRANNDGHTLLWASNAHTIAASLYKLNYDSARSFAPISQMGYIPDFLVVNPGLGVGSLKDLIALARARPGQLNFGSPGTGTSPYLEMALLMKLTNINLVHVGYKGGAPALIGLLGGEVQALFGSLANTASHVKAGKLKALAITGTVRSGAAPEVPTMAEAANLKGFETSSPWNGLMAPAGTPRAIVNRLHADMTAAIRSPDVQQALTDLGFVIVADTPEKFARTVADDIARWAVLLKTIDVK